MENKYNIPSVEEMFDAGVHLGHKARHWNPKMKPFIHSEIKGIHIINLEKTKSQLEDACEFLFNVAKTGKKIIFVGTKEQSREIIKSEAVNCGALYVIERFLGGTLTNYEQIKKNISKFVDLQVKLKDGSFDKLTKKEKLLIQRQIDKMSTSYAGLVGLHNLPAAVLVLDAKREKTAVAECANVEVPVVALIDTNTDTKNITQAIACNDDAIKSVSLLLKSLSLAVQLGYAEFASAEATSQKPKAESGKKNA